MDADSQDIAPRGKGNITKKLPRRTVVPVSDTIIFCVEVEQQCPDVYWTRNGEKLKEGARITIGSELRQYTLTIRDCQAHDSGEVAFMARDCKTSTLFTVTAAREHPPDPPTNATVQNMTDSSLTILWSPPDTEPPVPIKGYVVEKRKMWKQTWQRCNASQTITSTQVTVCNVSEEASYQFRISATNDFGQSHYLEVPGSFYLAPPIRFTNRSDHVTMVTCSVQDSTQLTSEVSDYNAPVIWIKNGRELKMGKKYENVISNRKRILVIHNVTEEDVGVYECVLGDDRMQIKLNLKDEAAKFLNKAGVPIGLTWTLNGDVELSCEVSAANASVLWKKDHIEIREDQRTTMVSRGTQRKLVIRNAKKTDAGSYWCETDADRVTFNVKIKEMSPPVFSNVESLQTVVNAVASQSATLSCNVADSKTEVEWFKNEKRIISSQTTYTEVKGQSRGLVIEKVEKSDAGEYVCEAAGEKLHFTLTVSDEAAKFLNKAGVPIGLTWTLNGDVELSCEVSAANASVLWKKDHIEIREDQRTTMVSRGTQRKLVIRNAKKTDAGSYWCETDADRVTFNVKIKEMSPPVFSNVESLQTVVNAVASQSATLSCNVADSKTEVEWFKNEKRIISSQTTYTEVKGQSRGLVIEKVEKSDAGEYVCEAAGEKLHFTLTVSDEAAKFLNKAGVPIGLTWTLNGDVELSCEVSAANASVLWKKDHIEIREDQRTTMVSRGTQRKLVIRNAKKTDAGSYWCETDADRVTFNVKIKEMSPPVFSNVESLQTVVNAVASQSATLSCNVADSKTEVEWFKNEKRIISSQTTYTEVKGQSRGLVIEKVEKSDAGEYVCEAAGEKLHFTLTVSDEAAKFLNKAGGPIGLTWTLNGDVELSCEVSAANASVLWKKDHMEIREDQRTTMVSRGTQRKLVIRNAKKTDEGSYWCETDGDRVTFNVKIKETSPPVFSNVESLQTVVNAVASQSATLSCNVADSKTEVKWFKNEKRIISSQTTYTEVKGQSRGLVIEKVEKSDAGEYVCEAAGEKLHFTLTVSDEAAKFLNKAGDPIGLTWTLNGDVELSCEVSAANASVLWKKDHMEIREDQRTTMVSRGTQRKLLIRNAKKTDEGSYWCETDADRVTFNFKIKETSPPVFSNVESLQTVVNAVASQSATLSCNVADSKTEVEWFKNEKRIISSQTTYTEVKGQSRGLVIEKVEKSDAGEYVCEAAGEKLHFTLTVSDLPVPDGSELQQKSFFSNKESVQREVKAALSHKASLSCEVADVKTEVKWYKEGKLLSSTKTLHTESKGTSRQLLLDSVEKKDAGDYVCEANTERMAFRLQVEEPPVVFSNKEWVQKEVKVSLTQKATLSCELSDPKVEVKWYKDGKLLRSSKDLDMESKGNSRQLVIQKMEKKDVGEYTCEVGTERLVFRLKVEETNLRTVMKDLGLEQYSEEKLSLSKILQIDGKTLDKEPAKSKSDLPWYFMKNLMMVNVTARNVKHMKELRSNNDDDSETREIDFEDMLEISNSEDTVNPLDVITALFLCSDGFVQQQMAQKMSVCQFSVPLLLPNCDSQQCTLMLWAMRDIVKQYRPEAQSESKGFTEERIVLSTLPMVSFVRLGECSLSKSETLNKLLSNSQQYHNIFVHHNMECGDSPRRISNGLTEMTWYLPCGNKNIDVFSQPVAVANLRGDIESFETQYAFLCQTSAAVFVFLDKLDAKCSLLSTQSSKTKIFLVGNNTNKQLEVSTLKEVSKKLGLTKKNIIIRNKDVNDVDFVNVLRAAVSDVISETDRKMSIEQMADNALKLGICVDENSPECQTAKQHADAITAKIENPLTFKKEQLPLQGKLWKDLTILEKEEFRLRKLGNKNIEEYKSDLNEKKQKLREEQNSKDMSEALTCFIGALSLEEKERSYFLKWMRINLDNKSRIKLSELRELYKEKWKSSDKEEIKKLDEELTSGSLGTEHLFREMSQIYEASRFLPETDPSRQQLNHLPGLCAQLLLDGFPLELVDGDASNIPLQWVSDVLSVLNKMVSSKNKILVVTVLGVQSTGKSTLLNTMFGVQFAVSSGRCTRGAFMLLIKVHEDFKRDLECDFIVIIDTEGLKSPELAQLDNSYEHDNELATLVVGLSDLTIVNIAMENITEMKDILQIVVHSFLRMKEVGKRPKCHFVHQNVSDVSAHEKNLRDRKLLLQQLDEMTQAAAKMEKKEEYKRFSDVMDYNPDTGNCYIPGLWNGNPPMAPVNLGYSETVYDLKKNILQQLSMGSSSRNDISAFNEWMRSLWNAVKHENFIFSFRNSLVADAYMRLCTEFNKWEWEFRKEMFTWGTNAETEISNVGTKSSETPLDRMAELQSSLESEAKTALGEWEEKLLENLTDYFKQTDGHVHLVEGHRAEFENSAKSLRRELEKSVLYQLTAAAKIRQGKVEIDQIKENQTQKIEQAVCALIDKCRKKKRQMTDEKLDKGFNMMWDETLKTLTFTKQKPKDIFDKVSRCLITNLSHKGSHASQVLSEKKLQDPGLKSFKYEPGFFEDLKNKVKKMFIKDHRSTLQRRADIIIEHCTMYISEKMTKKSDYHDSYIQEILNKIDERLQNDKDAMTNTPFEVNLKQHICGLAAGQFQKLHQSFLDTNDPYRCLMKNKDKFCADFKDVYNERDQCQKKAEEFANQCLKPAVEDRVNRDLGPQIIDEMLTCQQFSTRKSFQYHILLDLLDLTFCEYLKYSTNYEQYVKSWIDQQIEKMFSTCSKLSEIEDQLLKSIISNIEDAIKNVSKNKNEDVKSFVEDICRKLAAKLVIPQDALGAFMILNQAKPEQFADSITKCLEDMKKDLKDKFQNTNIQTKLTNLHMNPSNQIFTRVIGCGEQCPFCKTPCDSGANAHTEHFTSLHRPQGLGRYRWKDKKELITDICSSSVTSDNSFRCTQTDDTFHPYKDYKKIFPNWNIFADASLEASDYWKYVMTTYNQEFATEYKAKPAEIPKSWKNISRKQAEESLKKSFGV